MISIKIENVDSDKNYIPISKRKQNPKYLQIPQKLNKNNCVENTTFEKEIKRLLINNHIDSNLYRPRNPREPKKVYPHREQKRVFSLREPNKLGKTKKNI